MWTPRRIVLLLLGFVLFFTGYQVYAYFLGRYDGLPPLPEEYSYTGRESVPETVTPPRVNHAVELLRRAFGPNCEEQYRRIKLEWRLQGTVLAADQWKLVDGRLRLTQVSVAMFGKPGPNSQLEEINTVKGDQADIEFDKPITDIRDAASRKPVAGKIRGDSVVVHNNRRTLNPDDDLRLYTTWLAYRDDDHRIWTDADIRMVDSDPYQAIVTATGMVVTLIPSENAPREAPKQAGAKKPSVSGVKEVLLKRNVCMDLLMDSRSSFLGSAAPKAKPAPAGPKPVEAEQVPGAEAGSSKPPADGKPNAPAAPREKTPVIINCQGPFVYHVAPDSEATMDRAEFNERVNVIRKQVVQAQPGRPKEEAGATRYDQLDCDKLVLQFNRKRHDDRRRPADDRNVELEMVNAHATGSHVDLVSDAERLHATGNDLFYDKVSNHTILKGEPVNADQDGNQMRLHGSLILTNPPEGQKEVQELHAVGPGEIRMRSGGRPDEGTSNLLPKSSNPQAVRIARWQQELRTSKDGELDKLVFTGQASFEDQENGGLKAHQIIVWLETQTKEAKQTPKPEPQVGQLDKASVETAEASSPERNRRPRRLEATGNVSLDSKDLKITRTDQLRVEFQDRPPGQQSGTASVVAGQPAVPANDDPMKAPSPTRDAPAGGQPPAEVAATGDGASAMPRKDASPPKKDGPGFLPSAESGQKEPIFLTARTVDVTLIRDARKTDLKDVRAEGQVHVTQEGQVRVTKEKVTIKDKGVEIKGDRMDLAHSEEGNVLKVAGQPGYVQLNDLTIMGPIVNIDQPDNKAWVNGVGSMRMPSKTDFEGKLLEKPEDVTVYWNERMFFDGKYAEFEVGVQADQGDIEKGGARLACRKLEVVLDRFVSLKEKQPGQGDQPAGLYRMLCDQECRLQKGVRDKGKWQQFQRIEGREVAFDNPSSELSVYGPGTVHLLQMGSKQDGPLMAAPAVKPVTPGPTKPSDQEMKLTRVTFDGHMQGNKATNVAVFTVGVQLVHAPGEDPDMPLDPDHLPPGGLWMSCGRLKALTRKIDKDTTSQEFEATGRVRVRAPNYHAQADVVKFDESKDQLILEGVGGNLATLWRQLGKGRPLEPVSAERIWYWRNENRVKLDKTDRIQVNP